MNSLELARKARVSALKMVSRANASHIASSLSVIDILAVLYSDFLKNGENIDNPNAVIISKGHAAAGVYAILAHSGKMNMELLESYGIDGSTLGGHLTHTGNEGIELSTGSLGHGLPYGIGMAIGFRLKQSEQKTYVVMSDGECDEGTTWESALLANHFMLKNLVVIIDRNRLQSLGSTENTVALEPLKDKWESFNWRVKVVDGHSHSQLTETLLETEGPTCIIAETTKGKGVSFMEDTVVWHYRPPSNDELKRALAELQEN
jgi:transketolase